VNGRPVRVVFCWAEVSGYAAACFHALSKRPAIDVHVIHPDRLLDRPNPFDATRLLDGVSHQLFDARRSDLDAVLLEAVSDRDPDVVVLCGWIFWPYTRLVNAAPLQRARMMLGMDTPWRGTVSQRLGWLRLAHVVRRLDLVVTAGAASAQYAKRIGVREERIRPGFYGCDFRRFQAAASSRRAPWPRQFLFAGRYAPEKDLATLVTAYRLYRDGVSNPWGLTCRGTGPDAHMIRNVAGAVDAGFVAPAELASVFPAHGALILPSRFEPWGVVVAEAAAAGLPVICTSVCGAAADIVRPYYNGIVVPPRDPPALARAMRWMHDHEPDLPEMGHRSQVLAAPFSAEAWAARWHNYMLEILAEGGVTSCAG
jgi:glycosyltransferase involved in cell wall biosynthesis